MGFIFSFPVKNPELLNRWLHNLNIQHFSKSSLICCAHFHESDYKRYTEKRILKENAVPISSLCKVNAVNFLL